MALDDSYCKASWCIDRQTQHARVAFKDFSQLVRYYPNSLYSNDASKRLVFLKDRLAKFDLSVVEYYNKRGAYVAVVNRVQQMLKTTHTQKQHVMPSIHGNCLYEMGLNQANKVASIIAAQ